MTKFDERLDDVMLCSCLVIPTWGRETRDFWAEFRCIDSHGEATAPVKVRIREIEVVHVALALMPWWWSWHRRICKPAVRHALTKK